MFLLRNHHLIVATQKFDVFKTKYLAPSLADTFTFLLPLSLVWSKKHLQFSSNCLSSQGFEFYIMTLGLNLPQFLLSWSISLVFGPFLFSRFPCRFEKRAWLVTLSCSFFRFPLITSNLNCDPLFMCFLEIFITDDIWSFHPKDVYSIYSRHHFTKA